MGIKEKKQNNNNKLHQFNKEGLLTKIRGKLKIYPLPPPKKKRSHNVKIKLDKLAMLFEKQNNKNKKE